MKRFWTSDLHLGHKNILRYCCRPFSDVERMHNAIIRNINHRVKYDDVVMHVGDFCCQGRERGIEGSRIKADIWEDMLHGKWIFIKGNHDDNNGVKCAIDSCVVQICKMKAFVTHIPPHRKEEVPDFCDFVICGHVHEKWTTKTIDGIVCVNVGVDANRFIPLTDNEVIELYRREVRKPYPS